MAIVFLESFDMYNGNDTLSSRKWTNGCSIYKPGDGGAPATFRAHSTGCGAAGQTSTPQLANLPVTGNTFIFGAAVFFPSAWGDGSYFRLYYGAYSQMYAYIDASNSLIKVYNAVGTNVASWSIAPLISDVWRYFEWKVVVGDPGSAEARIDGQVIGSISGQNFLNASAPGASWNGITHSGGIGAYGFFMDDYYLLDGSGSVNNDYWGDTRIEAHFVSGAGSKAEWTPSAGSNFQNVDEQEADDLTTYNQTAVPGRIDTFNIEDLKNPGGTIRGVQVLNCASKDNAGPCTVKNVLRIDGVEYESAEFLPSYGAWKYYRSTHDVSPATLTTWDETEFNNMEVGYKRQS